MSDYLFRMVQRAAGTSVASAPRPPREVHWPLGWETHDSFTPTLPFRKTRTPQTARDTTSDSFGEKVPSVPPIAPILVSPAPPIMPVITPAAEARPKNDRADEVIRDPATVESLSSPPPPYEVIAHSASPTQVDENQAPVSRETGPGLISRSQRVAPEARTDAGRREAIRDAAIRGTNHDLIPPQRITETPKTSPRPETFPVPDIHANVQVLSPDRVPAPTAAAKTIAVVQPGERPRDTSAWGARETSEPSVEVKIGRVEVRFDTPAPPAAPTRPARPSGFAEFDALRRYVTQPWASGNR